MLTQDFKENRNAPIFVHSDLMPILSSKNIDLRKFSIDSDYQHHTLDSVVTDLRQFVGDGALWFPAFNYDFCQDGIFNLTKSVSQVGTFAEYFRVNHAEWRTHTPIFSFSGDGVPHCAGVKKEVIDPFDFGSDFCRLVTENGLILFYGANFSPTFIHFIERVSPGGPAYRYDKLFSGIVINGESKSSVTVKYHVMPSSLRIKYDTEKISRDLYEAGLLRSFPALFQPCYAITARSMLDFCLEKLNHDPLYFLTKSSNLEVSEALNKIGRRFLMSDFED